MIEHIDNRYLDQLVRDIRQGAEQLRGAGKPSPALVELLKTAMDDVLIPLPDDSIQIRIRI